MDKKTTIGATIFFHPLGHPFDSDAAVFRKTPLNITKILAKLARDHSWLPRARGKAVKIISGPLKHLPLDDDDKVIFTRRQIEETLASQRRG